MLKLLEKNHIGAAEFISEDEIRKNCRNVEKIAREMIRILLKRNIREEIEKLKQETEEDVH
jgi:hypothetical protein